MNLDRVVNRAFPNVVQRYDWRDSALYALGLGLGEDPLDRDELSFVYERDQQIMPSQCVVLGRPGLWQREPEMAIDWVKLLHGEQFFELHRPLAAEATVRATHHVSAVDDKGEGKGVLLHLDTLLIDDATGDKLASIRQTQFLRGDGGCGSFGVAPAPAPPLPEGAPDQVVTFRTLPQAALIYRLSGDINPIHADPEIARQAGFERPILHGLCTMGLACRAVLKAFCASKASRLVSMSVRFSKPVFPGETIRFEFYGPGDGIRFRAIAVERHAVVLDRGRASVAPDGSAANSRAAARLLR